MTRKHFELIAKHFAYNQATGYGFDSQIRMILNDAFKACNPNYNAERFWRRVDKLAEEL